MANKIIKFTLEADGTIPTYMNSGGFYPNPNDNASPQDWDLIGATDNGSSETGIGELVSEAAVKSYLDTYTSEWTEQDPDNRPDGTIPFNQTTAAAALWAKKIS